MRPKIDGRFNSKSERMRMDGLLNSMVGAPGAKPFKGRLIYDAKSVKAIRQGLDMSQKAFARLLLVEPATVQSWEQGRRVPDSTRMALLLLLHEHPKPLKDWLQEAGDRVLPAQAALA